MTMFYFTYLAAPTPDAKEYADSGGAYVDCWIQSSDRSEAEARAAELIREYGWAVEALEEGTIVTSQDYQEDDENREFYEQALMEQEVLVFNTWPRDEEDEDDEEEEDDDDDDEDEGDEKDDSV
jgi:hypothetical protein